MEVTIFNSEISATINTLGAELTQLIKNNTNYIWSIDSAFWNKTSPILFPIVGTLQNNNYTYNNQTYTLPRHGFARDLEFSVDKQLDHQVIFLLQSTQETQLYYPFNFKLYLAYTLVNSELVIEYFVRNPSEEILPFSLGAHPAFAINQPIENYTLTFNISEVLHTHLLQNNYFSGETKTLPSQNGVLQLSNSLFENDALVFKNLQSNQVILSKNNQKILHLTFDNFPYLGIWSKPNAPFLCLEPWCGLADNVKHNGNLLEKEGIVLLPPNEDFLRAIRIKLY